MRRIELRDGDHVLRYYETPIGPLPSVTTIIQYTAPPGEKAGLDAWRRRVGDAEAERIRVAAADRGTRVHGAAERLFAGQDSLLGLEPNDLPFWKAVERVARTLVGKTVHVEQAIWSPLGYAGTLDLVAAESGLCTLYDWKTSENLKRRVWIASYFLQAAAYAHAYEWLYGPVDDARVVIGTREGPDVHYLNQGQLRSWWRRFAVRLRAWQRANPGMPLATLY